MILPADDSLEGYLRLFEPYAEQLKQFSGREREYGGRFAMLFRQVVRRLAMPSQFNQRIPKLYLEIAERYLDKDPDTVKHFSYEDNRHFFLSELQEWLKVHQRGEQMRAG